MSKHTALKWTERGLWAVGVALALWCAMVLAEARRTRNMPVPAPALEARKGNAPEEIFTPPPAGAWVARLAAPSVHLASAVLEGTDDATLRRGGGHIEDTAFPGQ